MPAHQDPLWPVKLYLQKGGDIEWLAKKSFIPVGVIKGWVKHGIPSRVALWSDAYVPEQVDAFRRLYKTAIVLLDRHFG